MLEEENRLAILAKEEKMRTNALLVDQVKEKQKERQINVENDIKQNQDTIKETRSYVGESAAVIGGIGAVNYYYTSLHNQFSLQVTLLSSSFLFNQMNL